MDTALRMLAWVGVLGLGAVLAAYVCGALLGTGEGFGGDHFGRRSGGACASRPRRSSTAALSSPTAIAARSASRTNPSSVACRASAINGRQ